MKATKSIINLALEVLTARVHEQNTRNIVESYMTSILNEQKYINVDSGEIIISIEDKYEMSDEDFALFNDLCSQKAKEAGLVVNAEGNCPLLEAEGKVRKANRNLVDAMEPIFKVSYDSLIYKMDVYKEYIETGVKWALASR